MPKPPGWQLGGRFADSDAPLAEVENIELEALERLEAAAPPSQGVALEEKLAVAVELVA
jgi:hypothetical protein